MKVSELYEAVAKLGFEDSLEDVKAFYLALNRATVQINAIRPHIATYDIFHRPLENCISDADFTVREVFPNMEFYAESAKAYYFEVLGEGSYAIEIEQDGSWTTRYTGNFNTVGFTPYKGLIKAEDEESFHEGRVRIVFGGDYVFSVRNVALYDKLLGSDAESIPAYQKYTSYDLRELCTDFLALAENPIELEGYKRMTDGYDIEDGGKILLPYGGKGLYRVHYKRKVKEIEYKVAVTEDETEIDLDEELCTLLPLLCGYYAWLDDEPTKAQQYYTLYSERAKDIELRQKSIKPLIYETNGW